MVILAGPSLAVTCRQRWCRWRQHSPCKSEAYRRLELSATVLRSPELGGDASFGVSLFRPELLDEINAALERIKRNGTYDRINSRYLPFRVS
jgi:hypothetical protein